MSEFKGTKGKFRVSNQGNNGIFITNEVGNGAICRLYDNNQLIKNKEEAEANAKLIACAPEMLGMLKILLTDIIGKIPNSPAKESRIEQVEQLIKKATE